MDYFDLALRIGVSACSGLLPFLLIRIGKLKKQISLIEDNQKAILENARALEAFQSAQSELTDCTRTLKHKLNGMPEGVRDIKGRVIVLETKMTQVEQRQQEFRGNFKDLYTALRKSD